MNKSHFVSVIVQRPNAAAIGIAGLGNFDDNGRRDITRWVRGFQIEPGAHDTVQVVAEVAEGEMRLLPRTTRDGRSDDELRVLALADWMRTSGACFAGLVIGHIEPATVDAKRQPLPAAEIAQARVAALRKAADLHDLAVRSGLPATLAPAPAPAPAPLEKPAAKPATKE